MADYLKHTNGLLVPLRVTFQEQFRANHISLIIKVHGLVWVHVIIT
jgi:hypothetical protein